MVTQAGRGEYHTSAWSVWLQSLTIQPVSEGERRPGEDIGEYLHLNFVDNAHPNGLRVLLDTGLSIITLFSNYLLIGRYTGSSISDLPYDAIQEMHKVLGGREDKVPLPVKGDVNRKTYAIGEWVRRHKTQVKYVFKGYHGEAPCVTVYGPAETFVYLDHALDSSSTPRLESLIYPMLSDASVGVLGLVS